jgi:thioredoxin reductase (NADPH)
MARAKRHTFHYDCAVIGGGPGGLVSALYLSRFKRKVVLIDAGHSRAQWIPRIRNLIGYGQGLSGLALLKRLQAQVRQYKTDWVQGEAQIFRKPGGFKVQVDDRSFSARTVILATGMKDQQPLVDNVPALRKKGVLAYCPICDGYDHSGQTIGLLVRDNHGLKKMKFLSQFSKRIVAFQTEPFQVAAQYSKQAKECGFEIHQGRLESLAYRRRPRGLWVKMQGAANPVAVDVAYVSLGVDFSEKTSRSLKGLRRTKDGHIMTRSHQETSIPGLYAVGDCVNALAQVSVAIGQAALAATRIHNALGIETDLSKPNR